MTDMDKSLIESLIGAGGALVVGVFLYNKWQEYKAKKSVERAFSSSHDDVLMRSAIAPAADGRRHEPSFSGDAAQDGGDAQGLPTAEEPDQAIHAGEQLDRYRDEVSAMTDDFVLPVPRELPIDDMIDCVIPVALANKVRGDKVMRALNALRHVGNKPVHFIGLREDNIWEALTHGSIYSALHAGVQLANRSSVLNELEYSELVSRLRQVGDEIDADPDVPNMTEVMKSARALHQFVTQFDAQLSVNIQSTGAPWAIGTLLSALERQGFDLRPDGKLVMPDGEGGILFMLSTNVTLAADTTSRLTLLLDVPCVEPRRDGYGAMIAFARVLAARLGGAVVDDTNQPLSDEALKEIAGQVDAFCSDMEAAGVAAGSARALRLFS